MTSFNLFADPLVRPSDKSTNEVSVLLDVNLNVLCLIKLRKDLVALDLLEDLFYNRSKTIERTYSVK